MKVRAKGFNRAFFNLWFRIAPEAATKWLNFKLSVAEALDNIVRDENGISELEVTIILWLLLAIVVLFACSFLPGWPPK